MGDRTGQTEQRYLLIDTPIGACGMAWSDMGIARFQLPHASRELTEARLARCGRIPAVTPLPPAIEDAVAAVQEYMGGRTIDFSSIEVDLTGVPEFHREVYAALRRIPWGGATTYGELASTLGVPGAARAIGQAMGRNPVPVIIPCHRVLASGGLLGGFSAPGGRTTKHRLLALERVGAVETLPLFAAR